MWCAPAIGPKAALLEAVRAYARKVAAIRRMGVDGDDMVMPSPPAALVEAMSVNLRGGTLMEYAETDAQWHGELTAVLAVFEAEMRGDGDPGAQAREWVREQTAPRRGGPR